MDSHKNARSTVRSREDIARKVVEQGVMLKLAAASLSITPKTAAKWVRRFRENGVEGLRDRSSRPNRVRCPTPEPQIEIVVALRRQRWAGSRIASQTGLSRATVCRILRRLKLNRIRDLEPLRVYPRYEHEAAGDMLHLDIKKLPRFTSGLFHITRNERDRVRGGGYEYVHAAIEPALSKAEGTTAASPSPPSTRTNRLTPQSLPSSPPSPGTLCSVSASKPSSPTTDPATAPASSSTPAGWRESNTAAPDPTPQEPMERQNASSKQRSENGLMLVSTKAQNKENQGSHTGSTTTTGIDHTVA